MKILLFGKNGQVGKRLQTSLLPLGELVSYGREEIDFRNHEQIRQCIKQHNPQWIVNAAAYTKVDDAEDESELAFQINATTPKVIAEEAKNIGAWMVHYSTDYVFDGTKTEPYHEDDKVSPINVYGQSKALGDRHIQESGCHYLILRSSWVFSNHGRNFINTILHIAKTQSALNVVSDQFGAPTSATLITDVTSCAMYRIILSRYDAKFSSIYNIASSANVSWYDFAVTILQYAESIGVQLKCAPQNVRQTLTSDCTLGATRPLNSMLDTSKIKAVFGITLPHWNYYMQEAVQCVRDRDDY